MHFTSWQNSHANMEPKTVKIPPNSIVSHAEETLVRHRDTLGRVASILELMDELDLSEGLSPKAANGLFWINHLLITTLRHVSDDIKNSSCHSIND